MIELVRSAVAYGVEKDVRREWGFEVLGFQGLGWKTERIRPRRLLWFHVNYNGKRLSFGYLIFLLTLAKSRINEK